MVGNCLFLANTTLCFLFSCPISTSGPPYLVTGVSVWLVTAFLTCAHYKISKVFLDLKNSKTKTCFRPFWATLILLKMPPSQPTKYEIIPDLAWHMFGPPQKIGPNFFSVRFQKYLNQMCFTLFWTNDFFVKKNWTKLFFIKCEKYSN